MCLFIPTATASDKVAEPPNPDRNSFDANGNEYDYKGNLIHKAEPPKEQPIIIKKVEGFNGK